MITSQRTDHLLAHYQSAFSLRIGEDCIAGAGRADCAGITDCIRCEVVLVSLSFFYFISYACGQSFDLLRFAAFQLNLLRYAVRELHAAVGLLTRDIRQGYSECEFLILIRRVAADQLLADLQVSGFACVRELRICACSSHISICSGRSGRHVTDIRFFDGVSDACRETFDLRRLAAFDIDLCTAIREFDLVSLAIHCELTVNCLTQLDSKCVLCSLVFSDITYNFLIDRDITGVTCVGECKGCAQMLRIDRNRACQLIARCCFAAIYRYLRGKSVYRSLSDRVLGSNRYAIEDHGISARYIDGAFAISKGMTAKCTVHSRAADKQFYRKLISFLRISRYRAHNVLADLNLAGLARILHDYESRFFFINRTLSGICCARVGDHKVFVIGFYYFIIQILRQADTVRGRAILQRKGCNAVFEGHIAVRSVNICFLSAFLQGYGEAEVDILIGLNITFNRLVDDQAAFILRVGEGCDLLRCADRSSCTGGGRHITILVRFCLSYRVLDADRQSGRDCFLAALQGDLRNAFFEFHITEGSADRSIRQRYGECEFIVFGICSVDGLHHLQIAKLAGVLEGCFCSVNRHFTFHCFMICFEQVVHRFNHCVRYAFRESGNRDARTAFYFKFIRNAIIKVKLAASLVRILIIRSFAVITAATSLAFTCLRSIFPCLRISEISADLLVQHDAELEFLRCFCRDRANHGLADRNLSGLAGVLKFNRHFRSLCCDFSGCRFDSVTVDRNHGIKAIGILLGDRVFSPIRNTVKNDLITGRHLYFSFSVFEGKATEVACQSFSILCDQFDIKLKSFCQI